jgi:predicted site-specific integrase-resolvase
MERCGHRQGAERGDSAEARPEGKAQEETDVSTTRVAVYARVSTTNHGQDVTLQTRELQQFAEARGWDMVGA